MVDKQLILRREGHLKETMVGDFICLCVSRPVSNSLEVARQEDSIGNLHAVFFFFLKEQITVSRH